MTSTKTFPLPSARTIRNSVHATSRAGFTLIELLTVIAIIGILAAILIPTVGRVRNSAQQAKCASNLRQIGQQILLSANDNKGRLPNVGQAGALTWSAVTDPRVLNRTGNQLAYWLWPYYSRTPVPLAITDRNVPVHEMFVCPSFEAVARPIITSKTLPSGVGTEGRGGNLALSYIINDRQKFGTQTVFGYTGSGSLNLETIEKTLKLTDQSVSLSTIWALQDGDRLLEGDGGASRSGQVDFPEKPSHGAVRNRLYLDGSVKKLSVAASKTS